MLEEDKIDSASRDLVGRKRQYVISFLWRTLGSQTVGCIEVVVGTWNTEFQVELTLASFSTLMVEARTFVF